jgi:hypothetical protein
MSKSYEWSLIPYPYFRAFTLFNAFILSSIAIGIITGVSMELRDFFINYEQDRKYFHGINYNKLFSLIDKNHIYNPGEHIKMVNIFEPNIYERIIPQVIRVTIISSLLSFIVYLLMYFIFGYGGSLTSPMRKWRLFSSIKGNKAGKIFV